jgi:hypothetical protein
MKIRQPKSGEQSPETAANLLGPKMCESACVSVCLQVDVRPVSNSRTGLFGKTGEAELSKIAGSTRAKR